MSSSAAFVPQISVFAQRSSPALRSSFRPSPIVLAVPVSRKPVRLSLHVDHSPTYSSDSLDHDHSFYPCIGPTSSSCPFHSESDAANTEFGGGGFTGSPPVDPDGGGRSDDNSDDSREDVLARFGKAEADLTPDLKTLSPNALAEYLKATSGSFSAWLSATWPGWRRRVAADPEFPFKVLMELTVGVGLASSGMIAARGKNIIAELDFAICDIAVGATLNFILVYLLTPAIFSRPGPISRLPANIFAPGNYSLPSRLAGFFYKGSLFAVCGFFGSVIGTSASQSLVHIRRAVQSRQSSSDGDVAPAQKLPNVFVNSAAWAGFMFLSSNPRYQAVSGMERFLFSFTPEVVAKLGSGLLRTGNNVLGGAIWVWWSKAIGLQSSADQNPQPAPPSDVKLLE